jgi:hypothetical protein
MCNVPAMSHVVVMSHVVAVDIANNLMAEPSDYFERFYVALSTRKTYDLHCLRNCRLSYNGNGRNSWQK